MPALEHTPTASIDRPRDLTPVVVVIISAALLSLWLMREWPVWPALACAASGAAALMLARRAGSVANWPATLSVLLGLVDAGVWFILLRSLGAGLDPAVEPLARAAVLPVLAIGPVLVARSHPAGLPYALGQSAGLVIAGCWSLIEFSTIPPAGGSMWWPIGVGVLLGLGPLAWMLLRPSALAAISLTAIGLIYVSYNGAPALATVWAEKQLRDPAIYAASKATVEDLQDVYAVFAVTPQVVSRVMVRLEHGDWLRGGDYTEAYTITGGLGEGTDPRGRIFSVKSAEPHGDVLLSREVTLTEIETRAKPLAGQPMVLQAQLTRTMHPFSVYLDVWRPKFVGIVVGLLVAFVFAPSLGMWRSVQAGLVLGLSVQVWTTVIMAAALMLIALAGELRTDRRRGMASLTAIALALSYALGLLDLDRTW